MVLGFKGGDDISEIWNILVWFESVSYPWSSKIRIWPDKYAQLLKIKEDNEVIFKLGVHLIKGSLFPYFIYSFFIIFGGWYLFLLGFLVFVGSSYKSVRVSVVMRVN